MTARNLSIPASEQDAENLFAPTLEALSEARVCGADHYSAPADAAIYFEPEPAPPLPLSAKSCEAARSLTASSYGSAPSFCPSQGAAEGIVPRPVPTYRVRNTGTAVALTNRKFAGYREG
jgi:hypothetical protein